ncbi:MAG: beta-lactamase family protein [Melioribacteraceae bacterium]|nr:beta-lactamase family protein [Melioribacteraceae bacterium]
MSKKISNLLLFIFIFQFVFIAEANAQLKEASPESVGFSSERLSRLDDLLNDYINKGILPGVEALIVKDGKIVYYKALGYRDADKKDKMQKDDIFRIASQTKAITSTAVMILFEEGKFLLDDPIAKYLPEFKNVQVLDKFNAEDTTYTTVKPNKAVTIRHLLTHTSGIGYAQIGSPTSNAIYGKKGIVTGMGYPNYSLKDQINKIASSPLMHQPGEQFTYGLSIDVLGYLVEIVSGMPLDKFLKTRIFDPLGMEDTFFYLPKEKSNRLLTVATQDSTGKLINLKTEGLDWVKEEGKYFSGGAGLVSTAIDYIKFLQMVINGGEFNGHRILSPATIKLMTQNQMGDAKSRSVNKFGLGFEVVTPEGAALLPYSIGTYYWSGAFSSSYFNDPVKNISAQLVLQKIPSLFNDLNKKFIVLIYSALME